MRFPALRLLSRMLNVLGWFLLGAGVLGFVVLELAAPLSISLPAVLSIFAGNQLMMFLWLIGGSAGGFLLLVASESIRLLLGIGEDMRAVRDLLSE